MHKQVKQLMKAFGLEESAANLLEDILFCSNIFAGFNADTILMYVQDNEYRYYVDNHNADNKGVHYLIKTVELAEIICYDKNNEHYQLAITGVYISENNTFAVKNIREI